MSPGDRKTGHVPASGRRHTRRRILQLASIGTVGVAGCTQFIQDDTDDAEETDDVETPTIEEPLSTLIATWRGDDPTTATTVQWLSSADDDAEPVSVEFVVEEGATAATEETDVASFGEAGLDRHRAVVTDLDPDTQYGLVVDGDDTDLSVRTAPDEPTEPVTFAAGGDLGTESDVAQLHEQAASWNPLFALVGGDLAYAEGHEVGEWVTFLEQWHEHMRADGRLVPLVAAIGDHEVVDEEYFAGLDEASLYYSLFDNTQRERAYWALDIGSELSILLLDSNHTTEAAGTQAEWLDDELAERSDRDHLVVAYHIPAYSASKPLDDEHRGELREHWVPLFERHGVDVAFEHDDHSYKRTHPLTGGEPDADDGVLYLGGGAWGQGPSEVHSPDERPYLAVSEDELHVIRADLSPDGSKEFQAVGPDGTVIDESDSDE